MVEVEGVEQLFLFANLLSHHPRFSLSNTDGLSIPTSGQFQGSFSTQ